MDIVDANEIADRATARGHNTAKGTVYQWKNRGIGFPEPHAHLSIGPVWLWGDVEKWLFSTGRFV
jgi:hypothetical protein